MTTKGKAKVAHLNVRLPADLVARLDDCARARRCTRAVVIRAALVRGLAVAERKRGAK